MKKAEMDDLVAAIDRLTEAVWGLTERGGHGAVGTTVFLDGDTLDGDSVGVIRWAKARRSVREAKARRAVGELKGRRVADGESVEAVGLANGRRAAEEAQMRATKALETVNEVLEHARTARAAASKDDG